MHICSKFFNLSRKFICKVKLRPCFKNPFSVLLYEMPKLQFLHHSSFRLSLQKCTILIDPFVNVPKDVHTKARTKCPVSNRILKDADIVLISHEHFDHFDKKLINEIAEEENCAIVAHDSVLSEINAKSSNKHPVTVNKKMNIRGVTIEAFHVHHPNSFYPLGFKIESKNFSLIHTGDTFLTDSLNKLKADVLLVPIGGQITMDVIDAVKVVKTIEPKIAIPMHYNTFDIIKASPKEFKERIENSVLNTKPIILKPGESLNI